MNNKQQQNNKQLTMHPYTHTHTGQHEPPNQAQHTLTKQVHAKSKSLKSHKKKRYKNENSISYYEITINLVWLNESF